MKKILYTLLLLFAINAFSQNTYIQYTAKIHDETGLYGDQDFLRQTLDNALASTMSFGLIINKEGAKFYNEEYNSPTLMGDEEMIRLSLLLFAQYSGDVYTLDKSVYEQHLQGNKSVYTKAPVLNNWVISKETKVINGRLCQKATTDYVVKNKLGVFNHPVTAWYCTVLNYSYGPIGYGNLPGLITELTVRNVTYNLAKIEESTAKDFDIKFLSTSKIQSQKDFDREIGD
ncbi:GLPGLI family protein [Flavobacterium zepuense]|uniref:GLPGLI family protein n=1 Tax=Flavobacterium zepuense TaxID=2593302 RepID=A0A552UX24_9FLAO|nr:GLPGLI family protein [Flavobacterium zepuense]TRW22781.1 GLPGLI family protein [Flavobacterium zepuense]